MSSSSSSDSEGDGDPPPPTPKPPADEEETGPAKASGESCSEAAAAGAPEGPGGGDRPAAGKKKGGKKKGKGGKKKSYGGGGGGGGGGGAGVAKTAASGAAAEGAGGGRAASLAERIGDVGAPPPAAATGDGGAIPPGEQAPFPFTSVGGVQKRMKDQYDLLVKANVEKTLTLDQVGRFVTLLVDVKKTLVAKSEQIQRKFQIAKSLLSKADKSSCDRLCRQIYRLENEQKKLEEDTDVYNRMQEQLKQSPAYQSMLEYGRTHFELSAGTGQLVERFDHGEGPTFEQLLAEEKEQGLGGFRGARRDPQPEEPELSFEELLAQEKAAGGL